MKKISIALVSVVAMAGVASAQQAKGSAQARRRIGWCEGRHGHGAARLVAQDWREGRRWRGDG